MKVKNHDFSSASHLPILENQEPDIGKTIPENFLASVGRNFDLPFMSYRSGLATVPSQLTDEFVSISYGQSLVYIYNILDELRELGVKPEERCAIYAKNSPLWLLTDIAISFADCISVPIYDTLGIDNIKYCLELLGAKCIFVAPEFVHNIIGLADLLPSLEHVIVLDAITDNEVVAQLAAKVALHFQDGRYPIIDDTRSMFSFGSRNRVEISQEEEPELDTTAAQLFLEDREVESMGRTVKLHQIRIPGTIDAEAVREAERQLAPPAGQTCKSLNSVIFTSGTSGFPKAAIFSHSNVYAGGLCLGTRFVPYRENDKNEQSSTLSYLPLAHVFERALEHYVSIRGYHIYYSCGNIKNITKDFQLAKVSFLIGVPRVFQKVLDGFTKQLAQESLPVRCVFKACYKLKLAYFNRHPEAYRTGKLPLTDKIAFHKIADMMGGNIEMIVSGSAALPAKVEEFLRVCSCARVTNGFGMTELSASGLYNYCGQLMNTPNELGFVCAHSEAKLIDANDRSEFSLERDRVGELIFRGPGVVQGYVSGKWGHIEPIVDSDGYYHTGDLCKMHDDGSISFIRRISLVVKLQHGEFVDLCQVEDAVEKSPLITHAFVHAEADKSAPVCICSIDSAACSVKFGACTEAEIKAGLLKEIDKCVRQAGLKGFNVPRAVFIENDVDWTSNRDLFTPSQKKMAHGFRKVYKAQLEALFKEIEAGEGLVQEENAGKFPIFTMLAIIALAATITAFKHRK